MLGGGGGIERNIRGRQRGREGMVGERRLGGGGEETIKDTYVHTHTHTHTHLVE